MVRTTVHSDALHHCLALGARLVDHVPDIHQTLCDAGKDAPPNESNEACGDRIGSVLERLLACGVLQQQGEGPAADTRAQPQPHHAGSDRQQQQLSQQQDSHVHKGDGAAGCVSEALRRRLHLPACARCRLHGGPQGLPAGAEDVKRMVGHGRRGEGRTGSGELGHAHVSRG